MPQPEQAERSRGDHSTIWGIELEDGVLPNDGSSSTCDATIVIDAKKISHNPGLRRAPKDSGGEEEEDTEREGKAVMN